MEGALAGRAIWDVVWLRARATAGRVTAVVEEVALEAEVVREVGAVVVAEGARLRGREGPEGAFVAALGIERAEEVARRAGRLDVCLCWIAGVGRTDGWLALFFEFIGLSCMRSSFSTPRVSMRSERQGSGLTKRCELRGVPS